MSVPIWEALSVLPPEAREEAMKVCSMNLKDAG